jgi:hypothetical protein
MAQSTPIIELYEHRNIDTLLIHGLYLEDMCLLAIGEIVNLFWVAAIIGILVLERSLADCCSTAGRSNRCFPPKGFWKISMGIAGEKEGIRHAVPPQVLPKLEKSPLTDRFPPPF